MLRSSLCSFIVVLRVTEYIFQGKITPYEMDSVFTPASTQQGVYEECRDLITSVIDGYNVCIFAYGQVCGALFGAVSRSFFVRQTGSGKTFTMDGNDEHPGLNRRALMGLFEVRILRSHMIMQLI